MKWGAVNNTTVGRRKLGPRGPGKVQKNHLGTDKIEEVGECFLMEMPSLQGIGPHHTHYPPV